MFASQLVSDIGGIISLLQVLTFFSNFIIEIDNVKGSTSFIGISYLVLVSHKVNFVGLSFIFFFHEFPSL